MQRSLLLILVLLVQTVYSQLYNGMVRPITDYNQCYTGFVDNNGDTIWPVQFEKVSEAKVYHSDNFYESIDNLGWTAMYGGYYGVIDPYGKEIIPFKYKGIKPIRNGNSSYFIVVKDGKFGICNKDGSIRLNTIYDEIVPNGHNQFCFYEDGKMGQFDEFFNEIIPAKFSEIELEWDVQYQFIDSGYVQRIFKFYKTFLDDFTGIYDTLGNEIIPAQYHYIDIIDPTYECNYEPKYFRVNRDEKNGVYQKGKGEIIPPTYDDLFIYYLIDDCSTPYTPIVHGRKDNHKKKRYTYHIIDLNTGKVSESFDALYYYQDGLSFYEKDKSFGIIDSTLTKRVEKYPYAFASYTRSLGGHYFNLKKTGDLLVIYEQKKGKSPYHSYPDHPGDMKKGLYQLSTGQATEVKYDRIEVHYSNETPYYWAYTFHTIGMNELTIYDQDFNIVYQMDVRNLREINEPSLEEFLVEQPNYLVQDKNDKWGMLTASGKPLIPFNYSGFRILPKCDTTRFMLQLENGKRGIFDEYGNELIPTIYDSVVYSCDGIGFGILNGKYDGYKFQQRVLEGADHLSITNVQNYNHSVLYDYIGERDVMTSFYVMKNDTLYILENDSLTKLDRKRRRFDRPLEVYQNQYLINQFGRVIMHGKYTMRSLGNKAVVNNIHETKILDENGNELLHLDGYFYITQIAGYYHARGNGKVGIIDPETNVWIIEPKYDNIDFLRNVMGTYFQVRTAREQLGSTWQILDKKGEPVIPYVLDNALYFQRNENAVFVSNGRKGLLGNDLEVLLEPKYDVVFRTKDVYWISLAQKWGAYKKGNPMLEPQFSNVSSVNHNGNFIAFNEKREMIFINSDFSLSSPLSYQDLLYTSTLKDHLGKDRVGLNYIGNKHIQFRKTVDSLDVLIDNYTMLQLIYRNTFQELGNYIHFEELAYNNSRNNNFSDYRVDLTFFRLPHRQGRYYSYIETDSKGTISNRTNYDLISIHTSETQRQNIVNIDMTDSSLRRIGLADLFLENSRYDALLDSLIIKEINEKQLFGISCVDLNRIVAEYKSHYYLGDTGISFYRDRYLNGQMIIISYSALKAYFKHPEDFGM